MGPTAPTFEFLLPAFGDRPFFRDAVRSVVAQRDGSWRLTVLDDAGPDPVGPWLESLDDPRIRWQRHPSNLGVCANFNAALTTARADFVSFLGDDDLLAPDYLTWARGSIEHHPGADVHHPAVQVISETGEPVQGAGERVKARLRPPSGLLYGEPALRSLMHGNWTYFPSIVWRRSAIAPFGFAADLDVLMDLGLLTRLLLDGSSMALEDEVCFCYRRHTASYSSTRAISGHRFVEERRFYRALADELAARGYASAARAARWHLTSRLHAATLLPAAARTRRREVLVALARHVLR